MKSTAAGPQGSKRTFWKSHSALFGVAAAAISAMAVSPAAAQESGDEVIVVTGSRIARDPNTTSVSPVQTVNSAAITQSGVFNTVDVLNDVPALFFSSTSETQNLAAGPAGQNTLNLRGMGESRTLTLVNGRRFVSGVEGSQAVDVGGIPQALIERVEVLTGGASAIYGADAVTGVVNFVLKEDFEGFDLNVRGGISEEADAEQFSASALWGANFDNGRGNLTASLNYQFTPGIKNRDRDWAGENGRAGAAINPALRFQDGQIDPASMPNFAAYYNNAGGSGRFRYGNVIPSAATFTTNYTTAFGSAPTLTAAELALINAAATAPPFAILPSANFNITSTAGTIAPGDFFAAGSADINGNGTPDCFESYIGRRVGGEIGGCWLNDGGTIRTIDDGLIASTIHSFGGDGFGGSPGGDSIIPEEQRVTFTLNGKIEVTPQLTFFSEFLYSYQHVNEATPYNSYYDLLYGAPENPFIPDALQAVADDTGGLFITRDMVDLGTNTDTYERNTYRFVVGAEGEFDNGWEWEVAGNYGEFYLKTTDRNYVIYDRVFAAVDVVDDGFGNPICRSESTDPLVFDGSPPPGTPFGVPSAWYPGYYTFTPGDGQCAPANVWGGVGAISQAAIDFITTTVVDRDSITQAVFSAQLAGDFEDIFTLPGGPISFAVGVEHRKETSRFEANSYDRGILPPGSPFAGQYSGDPAISDDPFDDLPDFGVNQSLGPDGGAFVAINSSGDYSVFDAFIEFSAPILKNAAFADELTLDAAYRFSDYSTVGTTDTWKLGALWAPVEDIRFRGTIAQAVRAPNITELFSPATATTYDPSDPCSASGIADLATSDPARAATRAANCITALTAAGLSLADAQNFEPGLTARFVGTVSGNPDLQEETAETTVLGFVAQPRFIPGLTFSVDWWNIEIKDPINLLAAQDVVDNCYDNAEYPNNYCAQIVRQTSGAFQGDFQTINRSYLNLVRIEAQGVDFIASYGFDLGENEFGLSLQVTNQTKLDYYFDPIDLTNVNPELGELYRPEWGGSAGVRWSRGPFQLGYSVQYIGEQLLGGAGIEPAPEIETYEELFGDSAMADAMYLHDISARWEITDAMTLFGGVDNVTNEEPYITEYSWPSGASGRFFYAGFNARF